MRRYTCQKHKLDAKGPSIESLFVFVCGASHVKKHKLDDKGLPIRSPMLFVCGAVYVKSIS
jgi:hypothetical protein